MALPVLTTADDVRQVVKYLKTKPTGATVAEAKAAIDKRVLDPRKISAYQTWDFVEKDGERLKLTRRGWDLVRKPETEGQTFRSVIDRIIPYRSVLEWTFHQNLQTITNVDVAAHWHEHHSELLGTNNGDSIKNSAVCFFHLCQAAELGTMTIGRRGQPTRLEMNNGSLREYIEAGPSSPPWSDQPNGPSEQGPETVESEPVLAGPLSAEPDPVPQRLRVFISHGKNMEIVDQVQTMLQLADIDNEVAEKEESSAIPVPDKVFSAMRRCQAGIIAVTVEEGRKDAQGGYALNENVLIEIGAAFVLYDRKVVLLWDKRLLVPSNLQGLYRCEFEGNELSWSAGMKLMKAIQGFKKPAEHRGTPRASAP